MRDLRNQQNRRAAARSEFIPPRLRFLKTRWLSDAELREQALGKRASLADRFRPVLHTFPDDPMPRQALESRHEDGEIHPRAVKETQPAHK